MTSTKRWARPVAWLAASAVALSTLGAAPAQAADPVQPSQLALNWAGESGGTLGYASSRVACDVNADGYGDTVTGDWGWDRPGYTNTGAAYVLLGGPNAVGGESASGGIANPDSGAVRIDGPAVAVSSGAWIGWAVSCLGDVNGDGYDDIALGSGNRAYQKVTIVLGKKDFAGIDLTNLGADGFVIDNTTAGDINFGYWVGEVGDVNGDGLADIGIGDILADNNGRNNSGRVWVVAGSESVANVDVATPGSRVLRTIDGAKAEDRLGTVASAGDVNGDQVDDLIVSSYTATPWGDAIAVAGAGYVVFGTTAASVPAVDLANLGSAGFAIYGGYRSRDRLGTAVAPAGDVNGDGLADLLIGGDGVTNAATGDRNGGVAVVLGSASTATVFTAPDAATGYTVYSCDDGELDLTCANSGKVYRGYWINGAAVNSKAGWAVANAGDVNGDGVPDALIGADGGTKTVWIVYGTKAKTKKIELASLTAAQGWKVIEGFSRSVGSAGDVDGNGVPDLLAGNNTANKAVTILLGALKTEVALEPPPEVKAGESATVKASVAALVPSAKAGLAGTLSLERDGAPIEGCAAVTVTGSSEISCTLDALAAGASTIKASFAPSGTGYAAASASGTLTVAALPSPTPTETAPSSPSPSPSEPASPAPSTATPSASASPSPSETVTPVVKAKLQAKLKATAAKVKKGKKATVKITLGKLDNGAYPSGQVRIKYAGKNQLVKVTAAKSGKISVKLWKPATKTRSAWVQYLGSATAEASPVVKLKVRVR